MLPTHKSLFNPMNIGEKDIVAGNSATKYVGLTHLPRIVNFGSTNHLARTKFYSSAFLKRGADAKIEPVAEYEFL